MITRKTAFVVGFTLVCTVLVFSVQAAAGVAETKHNLSASGKFSYKTETTDQICIFCHTPHNANPGTPLWNHVLAESYQEPEYLFYSSPSSKAKRPSEIMGSSRLCLSCHDGTIALGALINPVQSGTYTVKTSSASLAYIGYDLSDDHPISIEIPLENPEVHKPDPASPVKLERVGDQELVQCTSCHDPHDNTYEPFLVMDQVDGSGRGGQLCIQCHAKSGWQDSAHAISEKLYTYDPVDPINQTNPQTKTIAQWGCQACHDNHGGIHVPLMNEMEEENCFRCHDGEAIAGVPDIRGEFSKTYTHPIEVRGVHFPNESLQDYLNVPLDKRHAECADCHEPHGVKQGEHRAGPDVPDSMFGTSGLEPIWSNGGTWSLPDSWVLVEDAEYEYQICLKCHSSYSYGDDPPPSPSRVDEEGAEAAKQTPIDRDFNPANPATHAVMGPSSNPKSAYGKFTGVDRDGNPWGWESTLLCSDCHGNDDPKNPIQGPHGSENIFILVAPYQRDYTNVWGRKRNATGAEGTKDHLCFRCHDYEFYASAGDPNYISAFSGSRGTNYHVYNNKHKRAGCQACHSAVPHGWHRQGFLVKIGDPSPYGDGAKNRDLPVAAPGDYPCGKNIICHP